MSDEEFELLSDHEKNIYNEGLSSGLKLGVVISSLLYGLLAFAAAIIWYSNQGV